MYNW